MEHAVNNNIRYIRRTQRIRYAYRLLISLVCGALFGILWLGTFKMPPGSWGTIPLGMLVFGTVFSLMGRK
jgi:hypothetical protein